MYTNIIIFLLFALEPSSTLHIGYTADEQRNWHRLKEDYEKCAFGVYQTPIHIEEHRIEPVVMPALDFTRYHNYLSPPLTIENNGHTVKLTFKEDFEAPTISGGFLPSSYVLTQLHFHWGKENDQGSEHMINNVRYAMEMHLVHRNTAYNTTKEALQHSDGLAVLGFFFQVQIRDNRRYQPIVVKLQEVSKVGSTTTLRKTFALSSLLPRNLDSFYTYQGSLTTPPCLEVVTWFVFPEPIPISFQQMGIFRSVNIDQNFRQLQEAGQRIVYLRRADRFVDVDSFDLKSSSARRSSSRSDWLFR